MEYVCRVCKKEFEELEIHLHKEEEDLLKERVFCRETNQPFIFFMGVDDIKEDHLDEFRKIRNLIRVGENNIKCLCGGKIMKNTYYRKGDYLGTIVRCDRCGFYWDEFD